MDLPNDYNEESIVSKPIKEKINKKLPEDMFPPPDKGYAWIIMIASMMNLLLAFGSPNAFGVFQAYYLKVLFANEPAGKIAWISTMTATCAFCGGLLASPLVKIVGMRNASLIGTAVATIGLLLASFSTQVWQLVLTQGIIYGLGTSLIINVSLSAPALWFEKYRGLAIGLVASGGSSGALILVPVVTKTVSNLSPLIVADYYPDEKVNQINGLAYLAMSISIIVWVPTTGVIFQKVGNRVDYSSIIILGAVASISNGGFEVFTA
ncbi:Monocarboxylate transporter 9 [Smittium mucronatum]|uniref:Monocarboxylate transporter 9 n=1 Tax=Smittium mucronatum TaxID=133383 RepID=A0A1R0GR29_9FUNG|nr:Monocarboxylate transporter 9 [Smittium mucronatum]